MSLPAKQHFSWGIASILVILNVLLMVGGCVVQQQAFLWFDDSNWQTITNVVGSLVSTTGVGVMVLICSWGPGSIWIRSLALVLTAGLFAIAYVATSTTMDSLNYEYYFSRGGVPLQIISHVGNGLSVLVPMMMVLSIIAAFGRWRIGPLKIGPIQIRIVDVMVGTAALAVLFVLNAEIQHRYYEEMFRDSNTVGMDDFASVSAQRMQTMMVAAVSAPIAAFVTSAAAWSLINRYAFLLLATIVMGIGAITLAVDQSEVVAVAGLVSAILFTCLLIAANIRLLGRAGWPLLRRKPLSQVADSDDRPAQHDADLQDTDSSRSEVATGSNSGLA